MVGPTDSDRREAPMRRTWMFLVLIALLGAAAVPAVDAAGKKKFRTKVTLDDYEPARVAPRANVDERFLGTVKSRKRQCIRRRTVNLYRTFEGNTELVGTGKSNRVGKFGIVVPFKVHNFEGEYVAKAKPKRTKTFRCRPGRSAPYAPFN